MPTRVKPKWGWEGRYLLEEDGLEIYSLKEVAALAKRHAISRAEALQQLKYFLERAAQVYRNWKAHDNVPRPNQIKAALHEIEIIATKLRIRLGQMDGSTRRFFGIPETEIPKEIMELDCKNVGLATPFINGRRQMVARRPIILTAPTCLKR